ncbi:MAG: ribbon-helix-helix protein, CopG family [Chloroflexota bacterium]
MADITITGEMAERLQNLARSTHRPVEEVLQEALTHYFREEDSGHDVTEVQIASFADMARVARENPINAGDPDIAERSREILRDEYADYLLKRLQDGE